ncbi:MAG: septation protein SepH [Rothia sp. (in: high G+C Gram-positive bacteria)]|nr:septation protein SepH [Rothia sp. (in: high G+C Gram-positive bacteria)]
MRELRLAGIHDDGENLVLESSDGATYLLPIDQNLRQSIARARRISPLRGGSAGGAFGPRDIQTRFRQGATVEEIAAESGWEPERVRRYEWPIVAERANIIQTARTAVISAAPGQGEAAQSLDQHIESVSERYDFTQAPMDWSTWQQESGQWTVSVDIDLGADAQANLPRSVMFPARWNFNPANQSIYASNEAAYFLMGRDHSHDAPIPGLSKQSVTSQGEQVSDASAQSVSSSAGVQVAEPRITRVSVPEQKEQNELLDELTARRGVRSFDPASERKLADLLERARRSSRPAAGVQAESVSEAGEDFSPVVETTVEQEETSAEGAVAPQPALDSGPVDANAVDANAVEVGGEEVSEATSNDRESNRESIKEPDALETDLGEEVAGAKEPVASDEEPLGHDDEAPAPKSSRTKRTSVPSWDDIIFGNQRR